MSRMRGKERKRQKQLQQEGLERWTHGTAETPPQSTSHSSQQAVPASEQPHMRQDKQHHSMIPRRTDFYQDEFGLNQYRLPQSYSCKNHLLGHVPQQTTIDYDYEVYVEPQTSPQGSISATLTKKDVAQFEFELLYWVSVEAGVYHCNNPDRPLYEPEYDTLNPDHFDIVGVNSGGEDQQVLGQSCISPDIIGMICLRMKGQMTAEFTGGVNAKDQVKEKVLEEVQMEMAGEYAKPFPIYRTVFLDEDALQRGAAIQQAPDVPGNVSSSSDGNQSSIVAVASAVSVVAFLTIGMSMFILKRRRRAKKDLDYTLNHVVDESSVLEEGDLDVYQGTNSCPIVRGSTESIFTNAASNDIEEEIRLMMTDCELPSSPAPLTPESKKSPGQQPLPSPQTKTAYASHQPPDFLSYENPTSPSSLNATASSDDAAGSLAPPQSPMHVLDFEDRTEEIFTGIAFVASEEAQQILLDFDDDFPPEATRGGTLKPVRKKRKKSFKISPPKLRASGDAVATMETIAEEQSQFTDSSSEIKNPSSPNSKARSQPNNDNASNLAIIAEASAMKASDIAVTTPVPASSVAQSVEVPDVHPQIVIKERPNSMYTTTSASGPVSSHIMFEAAAAPAPSTRKMKRSGAAPTTNSKAPYRRLHDPASSRSRRPGLPPKPPTRKKLDRNAGGFFPTVGLSSVHHEELDESGSSSEDEVDSDSPPVHIIIKGSRDATNSPSKDSLQENSNTIELVALSAPIQAEENEENVAPQDPNQSDVESDAALSSSSGEEDERIRDTSSSSPSQQESCHQYHVGSAASVDTGVVEATLPSPRTFSSQKEGYEDNAAYVMTQAGSHVLSTMTSDPTTEGSSVSTGFSDAESVDSDATLSSSSAASREMDIAAFESAVAPDSYVSSGNVAQKIQNKTEFRMQNEETAQTNDQDILSTDEEHDTDEGDSDAALSSGGEEAGEERIKFEVALAPDARKRRQKKVVDEELVVENQSSI